MSGRFYLNQQLTRQDRSRMSGFHGPVPDGSTPRFFLSNMPGRPGEGAAVFLPGCFETARGTRVLNLFLI